MIRTHPLVHLNNSSMPSDYADFDDMSCEMIFGQDPPMPTEDPAFNQPCNKLCNASTEPFGFYIHKCRDC